MKIDLARKLKLPDKPGVYFFKKRKSILYIGKATSLRDRTRSYFGRDLVNTRGSLILGMVLKADDIKWQVADSVLEALILEANLIKKHQPFYNRQEKDDKSWNHVVMTKEKLPRLMIIRGKNLRNLSIPVSTIYGPFTNGNQLKEALRIVRRIFPYLDEKSQNHYEFYRQTGWVPDLSTSEGVKQYKKNIKNLKLFFEGKKKRVISNFKKEMFVFAKKREFERAHEMKQRIFALQHINDIALIKNNTQKQENFSHITLSGVSGGTLANQNSLASVFRIEAYDIAHMSGKNMVGVMTIVIDEEMEKSEYKKFRIRTQNNANDTGALKEILERRLAHREWVYPNLIVVDGGVAQLHAAMLILKKSEIDIPVVSVVKDDKHKPKDILGKREFIIKYKKEILLANNEAHRFAIAYHKKMRNKNFLK